MSAALIIIWDILKYGLIDMETAYTDTDGKIYNNYEELEDAQFKRLVKKHNKEIKKEIDKVVL